MCESCNLFMLLCNLLVESHRTFTVISICNLSLSIADKSHTIQLSYLMYITTFFLTREFICNKN